MINPLSPYISPHTPLLRTRNPDGGRVMRTNHSMGSHFVPEEFSADLAAEYSHVALRS